MFHCDICNNACLRRLRFSACGHSSCTRCIEDLVWSNRDDHFFCCINPTCIKCGVSTDVFAETADDGTSRCILEKTLDGADTDNGNK